MKSIGWNEQKQVWALIATGVMAILMPLVGEAARIGALPIVL